MRGRWRGSTARACSIPASAPARRSPTRSRARPTRRTARKGRSIPASAAACRTRERQERIALGHGLCAAARRGEGDGGGGARARPSRNAVHGPERRNRHADGAPGNARRRGAGAQGFAGELSPRRRRRRCDPGHDAGHPRQRSVSRDPYPASVAGAVRYAAPAYLHHRLILDADGRKFSKRDRAVTLAALREGGATPDRNQERWSALPVVQAGKGGEAGGPRPACHWVRSSMVCAGEFCPRPRPKM